MLRHSPKPLINHPQSQKIGGGGGKAIPMTEKSDLLYFSYSTAWLLKEDTIKTFSLKKIPEPTV